ncbi:MAG: hypothetical protein ACP5HU_10390 [Phycisphaerae bacterium]
MPLVIDIADAVVAELAGGFFCEEITPQRRVLPDFELAELAELRVTVVPKATEIAGGTRSVCRYDVQVDIGIQKKLGTDLDAEVAALCGLTDEIAEFLRKRPLAAAPWAAWVGIANEPVYAPEHLAEQRAFTSVLTVTYRAMK